MRAIIVARAYKGRSVAESSVRMNMLTVKMLRIIPETEPA